MSPQWGLVRRLVSFAVWGLAGFWVGRVAGQSKAYYQLYAEGLAEEPIGEWMDGPRAAVMRKETRG